MTLLPLLQSFSNVAGVALLVLAGCSATYFLTQRFLNRRLEAIQLQIDHALASNKQPLPAQTLNSKTAIAVTVPLATEVAQSTSISKATSVAPAPVQAQPSADVLAHETLVVIAAAVSAFLGKSARLRSARLIQPSEGNAWAQQGRVFVQASHNLGLAHHG
jgi:methylmalonyl-CoA carboxyltransferase 12S subunit